MVPSSQSYGRDDDSDSDNEHDLATKQRLPTIKESQNKQQRLTNAFDRLFDSRRADDADGEVVDRDRADGANEDLIAIIWKITITQKIFTQI